MPGTLATNQVAQQPGTIFPQTIPQSQADWFRFLQRLNEFAQALSNAQTTTGVNAVPTQYSIYDGTTLPGLRIVGATSSQDATNVRFGTASLKLTATASTVSVTLGASGYPCTLQPNWKWIASLYLLCSNPTVAATLDLITPAGTKSVDVSGTVGADWFRLYGDYNLTADNSASGTLKLTFTGLTAGDTITLEAWQLEPVQGNTALPSPYIITSPPRTWAQVVDDGAKPQDNATLGADLASNVTNNTLDNVTDTATYARIKGVELSGGLHKIGIAGSGYKAGDSRNLPGSQVLGYGGVVSATPLSADSTGKVSVAAHTVQIGPYQASYNANASAVTGLTVGTTYTIYARDNYAGGSPTWLATTSKATANSYDDAYIAGTVTIPSSGASGGSNPKLQGT